MVDCNRRWWNGQTWFILLMGEVNSLCWINSQLKREPQKFCLSHQIIWLPWRIGRTDVNNFIKADGFTLVLLCSFFWTFHDRETLWNKNKKEIEAWKATKTNFEWLNKPSTSIITLSFLFPLPFSSFPGKKKLCSTPNGFSSFLYFLFFFIEMNITIRFN